MIPYTKLKEYKRQSLKEVLPLIKPFTLIIEPTNFCNFKCIQCFQSVADDNYFTRNKIHMGMECFRKVIDDVKNWPGPKLKVLKLSLYGEPFLNPNFCEMLKIAKEAELAERIETTTNASLLNPEICKNLIKNGLDYMRVSIYSAMQQKHCKVTGSVIDIELIRDNLKMLQSIKRDMGSITPYVSVKMLDAYSEENQLFIDMYSDVADEVYLDKPHNWIPYKGKDFINDLYKDDYANVSADLKSVSSGRIACTLPFFTLVIRSNGAVSPCCIDWIGGTNLGSIYRENLQEIWNGENMYEFRKMQLNNRKHENSSCGNCEMYASDYYMKDNIDGFPVEKLKDAKGHKQ